MSQRTTSWCRLFRTIEVSQGRSGGRWGRGAGSTVPQAHHPGRRATRVGVGFVHAQTCLGAALDAPSVSSLAPGGCWALVPCPSVAVNGQWETSFSASIVEEGREKAVLLGLGSQMAEPTGRTKGRFLAKMGNECFRKDHDYCGLKHRICESP